MRFDSGIGILLIIAIVLWLFNATKNTEMFGSSDNGWYMWGAMPWNGWNYGTAEEYDL